jgi:hypothetical protein
MSEADDFLNQYGPSEADSFLDQYATGADSFLDKYEPAQPEPVYPFTQPGTPRPTPTTAGIAGQITPEPFARPVAQPTPAGSLAGPITEPSTGIDTQSTLQVGEPTARPDTPGLGVFGKLKNLKARAPGAALQAGLKGVHNLARSLDPIIDRSPAIYEGVARGTAQLAAHISNQLFKVTHGKRPYSPQMIKDLGELSELSQGGLDRWQGKVTEAVAKGDWGEVVYQHVAKFGTDFPQQLMMIEKILGAALPFQAAAKMKTTPGKMRAIIKHAMGRGAWSFITSRGTIEDKIKGLGLTTFIMSTLAVTQNMPSDAGARTAEILANMGIDVSPISKTLKAAGDKGLRDAVDSGRPEEWWKHTMVNMIDPLGASFVAGIAVKSAKRGNDPYKMVTPAQRRAGQWNTIKDAMAKIEPAPPEPPTRRGETPSPVSTRADLLSLIEKGQQMSQPKAGVGRLDVAPSGTGDAFIDNVKAAMQDSINKGERVTVITERGKEHQVDSLMGDSFVDSKGNTLSLGKIVTGDYQVRLGTGYKVPDVSGLKVEQEAPVYKPPVDLFDDPKVAERAIKEFQAKIDRGETLTPGEQSYLKEIAPEIEVPQMLESTMKEGKAPEPSEVAQQEVVTGEGFIKRSGVEAQEPTGVVAKAKAFLGKRVEVSLQKIREATVRPDIGTGTYKNTHEAVETWRKESNSSIHDSQILNRELKKTLPDVESRKKISHVLDGAKIELNDKEKAVLAEVGEMYEGYRKTLKDEGILEHFLDDYVNHIIISSPKKPGKAKGGGVGGKLGSKPAQTKQRVRKSSGETYTLQEWKDEGYEVQEDIAVLSAWYKHTAEKARANKKLVDYLKTATTDDGKPLLTPWNKVGIDDKGDYVNINDASLRKWSGKKKGKRIYFTEEPMVIHKDAFPIIDNVISVPDPPGIAKRTYFKARTGVKRLVMYNPLFHGFNIESNVIMGTKPWNYVTKDNLIMRVAKPKSQAEIDTLSKEMVRNGVELEGLFEVGKRLREDTYTMKIPEDKTIKDMIKSPIKTLVGLNDNILWDKFVKTGQMVIYSTEKQRGLDRGLSEAQAGQNAAMFTNDLMGTIPKTWFTSGQRKWLSTLLFAKNWNVSNFRTLTGATGRLAKTGALPKPLRFEGLTDKQLKSLGKSYRSVLLKGVIGVVSTANAIQAMMLKANGKEFHPIWENEEGHLMDIDTGHIGADQKPDYLKNWLFRQIDDYAKLLEGHPLELGRAKAEPILRTMVETIVNQGWHGKPIMPKGATRGRQLKELAKYVVKGLTPVDSFVGFEDQVKDWYDIVAPLTGTWIRHGMPTGQDNPQFGTMLKGYYKYRDQKKLLTTDEKKVYRKHILLGEQTEARKLVNGKTLTPAKAINIEKSLKRPLLYRIATPNGKMKSDFVEYLLTLPPKKQEQYKSLLRNLKQKGK